MVSGGTRAQTSNGCDAAGRQLDVVVEMEELDAGQRAQASSGAHVGHTVTPVHCANNFSTRCWQASCQPQRNTGMINQMPVPHVEAKVRASVMEIRPEGSLQRSSRRKWRAQSLWH